MVEKINTIFQLLRQMASGKFMQAGNGPGTGNISLNGQVIQTIAFPLEFDNTPEVIPTVNSARLTIGLTSRTPKNFEVTIRNDSNSSSTGGAIRYFAVDTTYLKMLFGQHGGGVLLKGLPCAHPDWGWAA